MFNSSVGASGDTTTFLGVGPLPAKNPPCVQVEQFTVLNLANIKFQAENYTSWAYSYTHTYNSTYNIEGFLLINPSTPTHPTLFKRKEDVPLL
jgi:hypothetical protein